MVSKCVDREGTACTKVVLQARAGAVVRRWLRNYSSRALVATYVDLLTGLWLFVSLFGPLVLWGRWLLAFSVRRVPSLPWEGAVVVLSVSWLFVVLVFFPVEEFFLFFFVLLPLLGSCLLYVLRPFSRHFPSCGVSARWRDLPNVVLGICRK